MRYLTAIPILAFAIGVYAAQPMTLEQARSLSAKTHKPILMEFVHQD